PGGSGYGSSTLFGRGDCGLAARWWSTSSLRLEGGRVVISASTREQRIRGLGWVLRTHSPWQTPYVERMIGSIRRECLENVVVLSERHLRRILSDYFSHYNHSSHCPFVLCA
ncbi:MAG: integrase core domain-containing protein, partial [Thermoanaerobaculia bacterium]